MKLGKIRSDHYIYLFYIASKNLLFLEIVLVKINPTRGKKCQLLLNTEEKC